MSSSPHLLWRLGDVRRFPSIASLNFCSAVHLLLFLTMAPVWSVRLPFLEASSWLRPAYSLGELLAFLRISSQVSETVHGPVLHMFHACIALCLLASPSVCARTFFLASTVRQLAHVSCWIHISIVLLSSLSLLLMGAPPDMSPCSLKSAYAAVFWDFLSSQKAWVGEGWALVRYDQSNLLLHVRAMSTFSGQLARVRKSMSYIY